MLTSGAVCRGGTFDSRVWLKTSENQCHLWVGNWRDFKSKVCQPRRVQCIFQRLNSYPAPFYCNPFYLLIGKPSVSLGDWAFFAKVKKPEDAPWVHLSWQHLWGRLFFFLPDILVRHFLVWVYPTQLKPPCHYLEWHDSNTTPICIVHLFNCNWVLSKASLPVAQLSGNATL